MADNIYDEIEIEDMVFDATMQIYTYPCPCGDKFEILIDDLRDGEDIAVCPSCSLMIRVIYEVVSFSIFFLFSFLLGEDGERGNSRGERHTRPGEERKQEQSEKKSWHE